MGITFRTTRDVEDFVGADPLDVMHADVDEFHPELCELLAFRACFDAERKAVRSHRANEIAREYEQAHGKAPSEALLERLAAADDAVLGWLADARSKLARLAALEWQYEKALQRINRGQAVLRFAAAEPRT